jgi:fatty acid desaturase
MSVVPVFPVLVVVVLVVVVVMVVVVVPVVVLVVVPVVVAVAVAVMVTVVTVTREGGAGGPAEDSHADDRRREAAENLALHGRVLLLLGYFCLGASGNHKPARSSLTGT